MPIYYFTDAEGNQCFVEMPKRPVYAEGRVSRAPEPFERWDEATETFILDEQAKADHLAGPAHIERMHIEKSIEARLIAGGILSPEMLLVKEAEVRGITPAAMAGMVLEKAALSIDVEIERQRVSLPKSDGGKDSKPSA